MIYHCKFICDSIITRYDIVVLQYMLAITKCDRAEIEITIYPSRCIAAAEIVMVKPPEGTSGVPSTYGSNL